MPLNPSVVVDAPPVWLPVHTLRNASPCYTEVTDPNDTEAMRIFGGYTFEPDPCPEPTVWDPTCGEGTDPYTGDPVVVPGGATWEKSDPTSKNVEDRGAVAVAETAFSCATTGFETIDYERIARDQLNRIIDKVIEWQAWSGAATIGNDPDSLRFAMPGVTVVNDDPTVPISGPLALQSITQAWANCGPGGRGMIHAPPSVVAGWSCECMHEMTHADLAELNPGEDLEDGPADQRRFLATNVGHHTVVPGQGYPGTGPNGEEPDPGTAWIYMTGPVCVVLGPVQVLEDEGRLRRVIGEDGSSRPTNEIEVRAERPFTVYFDPDCCVVAALVSVSCCC